MREWRDIPGFEGFYQASDDGLIRSLDREIPFGRWGKVRRKGHIIKPRKLPTGYLRVALRTGNARKYIHVNNVVCLTFNGPPSHRKMAAHFPDPDKSNNHAKNLVWATAKENSDHRYMQDTILFGENNPSSKLTLAQVDSIRSRYVRGRPHHAGNRELLAKEFGVCGGTIQCIVSRKTWSRT